MDLIRGKGDSVVYTLVDFITHIKGVEYLLSILAIGGFLLLWEILKPSPFRSVLRAGKNDLAYVRQRGYGDLMRDMGKIAAAPFIGLAYLVVLPVGFAAAAVAGGANIIARGFCRMAGKNASFDWKPMEAFFQEKKRGEIRTGREHRDAAVTGYLKL